MAGCNIRDLERRLKVATAQQSAARRDMDAANKRIAAIGERASRGRPRSTGQSKWAEQSYQDRPTSRALMTAYEAAMKRSQSSQGDYWRASDEVRSTSAALKFCRGSGLGRTKRKRR